MNVMYHMLYCYHQKCRVHSIKTTFLVRSTDGAHYSEIAFNRRTIGVHIMKHNLIQIGVGNLFVGVENFHF